MPRCEMEQLGLRDKAHHNFIAQGRRPEKGDSCGDLERYKVKGNFENCRPSPAEKSLFSCNSDKGLACVGWPTESRDREGLQDTSSIRHRD